MTLRQKEYLSIGLALAGAFLGFAATKMDWGTVTVYIALAILAAGLVLRFAWHRCPHCGGYLGRHWERSCPSCGKWIDYDMQ